MLGHRQECEVGRDRALPGGVELLRFRQCHQGVGVATYAVLGYAKRV